MQSWTFDKDKFAKDPQPGNTRMTPLINHTVSASHTPTNNTPHSNQNTPAQHTPSLSSHDTPGVSQDPHIVPGFDTDHMFQQYEQKQYMDGIYADNYEIQEFDSQKSASKASSRATSSNPEFYNNSPAGAAAEYYQPQNKELPPYELNIDNLSFMDGLNFPSQLETSALGNSSSAYPPSVQQDQTPSLLAMNKKMDGEVFPSPILPGQNEKSFNNQHYYHKHKDTPKSVPSSHVRPDAVFTPLVSPAVTPLESQVNANRSYSQPASVKFEPLTSPALAVQHGSKSTDRRRSSSSVYGPGEEYPSTYKRRTPHGTPVLSANGSKAKHSPSLKVREKSEPVEMLPPSSKKVQNLETSAAGTPLMGFTMGRLAEQQSEDEKPKLSRASSYKHGSSSEASPVLETQKAKRGENPTIKRASHKLAEQGRRNRMNMAVQELSTLIPKHYHDEVSIPSKATTVELASRYIRDLLRELDRLDS